MLQNFRLAAGFLKQHVSHQMPDHLLPYLATTQAGRLPPSLHFGRLLLQILLVPELLMLPILRTPGLAVVAAVVVVPQHAGRLLLQTLRALGLLAPGLLLLRDHTEDRYP